MAPLKKVGIRKEYLIIPKTKIKNLGIDSITLGQIKEAPILSKNKWPYFSIGRELRDFLLNFVFIIFPRGRNFNAFLTFWRP